MLKPQLLIACDFDGTVTRQDTLVEILERYGSGRWREVQEKVVSGELSIRDGLQSEMGPVRATPEEMKSLLTEKVEVDPTFPGFLRSMRQRGIPLVCLSGGFDLCLEIVLSKAGLSAVPGTAQAGLWPLPYLANRLIRNNGSWRVEFPYPSLNCQACGHCKGDPIRGWNEQGYLTVLVGNGVTDRCGARHAKLTFAKDDLHAWAQAQGIASVRYETFDDIEQELLRRGWL